MEQYIKIGDSLVPMIACYAGNKYMLGSTREAIEIIIEGTYAFALETFVNDLEYSIVQVEDGTTYEFDKTNYCLSGDIVDHRDGTVSIYMGEKTDTEELLIALYGGAE